jgi:hypothetical protein
MLHHLQWYSNHILFYVSILSSALFPIKRNFK